MDTQFIGYIYKLICSDGSYYIGSTKNILTKRLSYHKSCSAKFPERKIYAHILTVGWDNVKIDCIEECKVNSRKELYIKEDECLRQHILNPQCLNENKVIETEEEKKKRIIQYREENKEKIQEYKESYRIMAADTIKEYNEKYVNDHKEEIKERRHKYYEKTKEKSLKKSKEYNETHKEEIQEYKKQWQEENKEEIAERSRSYRKENKEKIKQKGSIYYAENKEYILQKNREYQAKHKEKLAEQQKEYREKNKELIQQKQSVKQTCECGGKYTIHHKSTHIKSARHLKYNGAPKLNKNENTPLTNADESPETCAI